HALGALALGDVGDAATPQAAAAARQPHQAHFAHDLAAGGVPVQPLEHRRAAFERLLNEGTRAFSRGHSVGLQRWGELDWSYFEEPGAVEAEELLAVDVGIDEAAGLDIEHDDPFGGVVDG